VLLLLAVSPVSADYRYAITAVPPLALLLCSDLSHLFRWVRSRFQVLPKLGIAGLVLFTILYGRAMLFAFQLGEPNAYKDAVEFVLHTNAVRNASILVPANDEGGMIAEFAMRDNARAQRFLARPSKLFGQMDWNFTFYRPYYKKADELEQFFEQNPIDIVITAEPLDLKALPHQRLLTEMLRKFPERWKLLGQFPQGNSRLLVYQFAKPAVWGEVTPLYAERTALRVENILNK
jgi:hypothetical protein